MISVLMVLFLLPVLLTLADPLLMKEEAKKIKIEETRQAMKQKKRDLKEQMKQKTVQMIPGQPEKKIEAEQMGPVKQDKKIEAEQPSKNIEDEVKENEK